MIWLVARRDAAVALGRERRQQLRVALVAGGRVEQRAQEPLAACRACPGVSRSIPNAPKISADVARGTAPSPRARSRAAAGRTTAGAPRRAVELDHVVGLVRSLRSRARSLPETPSGRRTPIGFGTRRRARCAAHHATRAPAVHAAARSGTSATPQPIAIQRYASGARAARQTPSTASCVERPKFASTASVARSW